MIIYWIIGSVFYFQRQGCRYEQKLHGTASGTKMFMKCTTFHDKPAIDIHEDHKQHRERRIDSNSRSTETIRHRHRISTRVDMESASFGLNFIERMKFKDRFFTVQYLFFILATLSSIFLHF